jgi:hypothetical protein
MEGGDVTCCWRNITVTESGARPGIYVLTVPKQAPHHAGAGGGRNAISRRHPHRWANNHPVHSSLFPPFLSVENIVLGPI